MEIVNLLYFMALKNHLGLIVSKFGFKKELGLVTHL
jgi:hypothetical protein